MRSLDLAAVTRLHRRRREKRAAYRNAVSSRVALGASLYLFSRSAHSTVNGKSWDTVWSRDSILSVLVSSSSRESVSWSRCRSCRYRLGPTAAESRRRLLEEKTRSTQLSVQLQLLVLRRDAAALE